jgi:hypothetical protein
MEPVLAVSVTVPPPGGKVGQVPITLGKWVGALPPGPPGMVIPLLDPVPVEPLEELLLVSTPPLLVPVPGFVPLEEPPWWPVVPVVVVVPVLPLCVLPPPGELA